MTNKKLNSIEDKIKEYLLNPKEPVTIDSMACDITKIVNEDFVTMKLYRGALKLMHTTEQENAELTEIKDIVENRCDELLNDNIDLKATIANMKKYYCSDRANCNELNDLKSKLILRNGRILELEEEVKEDELINKHHIDLIGRQEQQLADIKYLNRAEVDDFVKEVITIAVENFGDEDGESIDDLPMQIFEKNETDFNRIITAICNLAIPEQKQINLMKYIIETLERDVKFWKDKSRGFAIKLITEDKITEVLKKYKVICTKPGTNFMGDNEQLANEILNNKSDKEE